MLVGGMVAIGSKKMSAKNAQSIEEHTGAPPEELEARLALIPKPGGFAVKVKSDAEFEIDENLTTMDGGTPDDSDPALIPAVYYVRPLGEDWRLGLSMSVPSGFGASNGSTWVWSCRGDRDGL